MLIQNRAKVMRNYTICLPKKIRKEMDINEKDIIIMIYKDNSVTLKKAPSSWESLSGLGKKVYETYGSGEAYLKKEREGWGKKN